MDASFNLLVNFFLIFDPFNQYTLVHGFNPFHDMGEILDLGLEIEDQ